MTDYERGRADERKAVADWLRSQRHGWPDGIISTWTANRIEDGYHMRKAA